MTPRIGHNSKAMGESSQGAPRRGFLRRLLRTILIFIIALAVLGIMGWCALFLWQSPLPGEGLRVTLAVGFVLATLASFILFKKRLRTLAVFLAVFALLVVWYYSIRPSHDRQWQPEVAVLPTAEINGDLVTVKNIRDFDYRSETDYTARYIDRTYDLNKLESTDLICVYWMGPAIAHVIVSFGFEGGEYLAFSIEMRSEQGEENSMVRSFFRKYELIYVAATERDIVRLRTNYREPLEQVYVYRTRQPAQIRRALFLSYIDKINQLAEKPEWYNTLRDNCTTGVLDRTSVYRTPIRFNWKILFSGYVAEFVYEGGMLDTSMPFEKLQEQSLVNEKAKSAGQAEDFSTRIREGLPRPEPMSMEEFKAAQKN